MIYYWAKEFFKSITITPIYDSKERKVNVFFLSDEEYNAEDSSDYEVYMEVYLFDSVDFHSSRKLEIEMVR